MKRLLFVFSLLLAPVGAADVLLVGTAEPELAFVRATAFKPFHARFDIPFDEAKTLAAADLAARKVVILARGAVVADAAALQAWVERGGTLLAFSSALPPGLQAVDLGADPTQVPGDLRLVKRAERLAALVEAAKPETVPTKREPWGYTPLGAPAKGPERTGPLAAKRPLPALRHERVATGEALTLVQDGKARAVIVLPAKPSSALRAAADDLVDALARISGATVPIIAAGAPVAGDTVRIVLGGDERWPSEVVARVKTLPPEGFVQRTLGQAIHLAGSDVGQGGLALTGTAHGVYDFIERQLGVRWLWPGEAGTVFPRRATITIPPLDIEDAPAFSVRRLRNYGGVSGSADKPVVSLEDRVKVALNALGRPDLRVYAAKHAEANPWFSRLRLGQSRRVSFGHAYNDYVERFAGEHPEWFALQPDGTRAVTKVRPRLDKENPGLIAQAARDALRELDADPLLSMASLTPNDGGASAWDLDAGARLLDPVDAPPITLPIRLGGLKVTLPYVSMTDRMVTFYNGVAEEVQRLRPGTVLGASAYSAYRTPPLRVVPHPQLAFTFVGLVYFDESTRQRDRRSWDGWAAAGNALMLRPNALHSGHGLPGVFVTKLGEDLRHGYETMMFGADFDSIIHHWSTQGLNYYVLAKLLWNPAADVPALVDDYCCAGFGAAAPEVKSYFAQLEALTSELAAGIAGDIAGELRAEEDEPARGLDPDSIYAVIPKYYGPARLAPLRATLARAAAAARSGASGREAEVLRRIVFLGRGLDYAEQQAKIYALVNDRKRDAAALAAAVRERQAVFHDIYDRDYFAIGFPRLLFKEQGVGVIKAALSRAGAK
jgi:hypothetical protein